MTMETARTISNRFIRRRRMNRSNKYVKVNIMFSPQLINLDSNRLSLWCECRVNIKSYIKCNIQIWVVQKVKKLNNDEQVMY